MGFALSMLRDKKFLCSYLWLARRRKNENGGKVWATYVRTYVFSTIFPATLSLFFLAKRSGNIFFFFHSTQKKNFEKKKTGGKISECFRIYVWMYFFWCRKKFLIFLLELFFWCRKKFSFFLFERLLSTLKSKKISIFLASSSRIMKLRYSSFFLT
jgi:hypothetical protein